MCSYRMEKIEYKYLIKDFVDSLVLLSMSCHLHMDGTLLCRCAKEEMHKQNDWCYVGDG